MGRIVGLVMIGVVALAAASWAADEAGAEQSAADEAKKIALFNGTDFTGWKLFSPDENADLAQTWSVKDGVVHCTGSPAGYMRTTRQYENYRLTWEWRWTGEGGNSGCLLHLSEPDKVWPKSIECQLMSTNAADFWLIDGTDFKEHTNKEDRRVPKMHEHNEKELGKWNKGMAVCEGDTIKLYINGLLQNQATEATVTKGYIAFQSEGAPIEFRKIILEPLEGGGPVKE
ncbi:MAG: DUF1080 domain-containing protein [Candidatus Hydrogenedentes bacterium]|nr:DUF1080 domain-containing protein [Candidatus Hydrogenedentota bacterium]